MSDYIFAEKLREARQQQKLKQSELETKSGVQASLISNYENGTKKPSLKNTLQLAKALGISIDWLCGYKPKANTPYEADTGVPFALLTVIKELNPRIESESQDKNGISKTAATLIFDDDLFNSIIAEHIKNFIDEYLTIKKLENEKLATDDMIRTLEDHLLNKYKHLPGLPDYVGPTKNNK